MQTIARQLTRSCMRLQTAHTHQRLTTPITTPILTSIASPTTFAITQPSRSNSTLPVTEEYVRRTYPFPTVLESDLPPDYSKWLWYHHQFPGDLPLYKSKLTVDIRDLGLDPTSRMVLREIVAGRYNRKTHQISFVSRNLPTAQANENRVFQQLDACLVECRAIAKQLNEEGFYAKNSGAAHNRLLKPIPEADVLKKEAIANKKRMIDAYRKFAGLNPLHTPPAAIAKLDARKAAEEAKKAIAPPAPANTEKPTQPRDRRRLSTRKLNAAALGLTKEETDAIPIVPNGWLTVPREPEQTKKGRR